jgi:TonB family protein
MLRLLMTAGLCAFAMSAFASEQSRTAIAAAQATASTGTNACADVVVKRNRVPDYPINMLSSGTTGTVILGLTTDACGRVTSAQVRKSSGHKALDDAAASTAGHWILTADARAGAVDGVVTWPVVFKMDNSAAPVRQPDWPKTHRHVRWLFNDAPNDYPSAATAEDAIRGLPASSGRMVPYLIPGSGFIQMETSAGTEFWYFIDTVGDDPKTIVAARYEPVYDNGEPIVRLSVFCDVQPNRCVAFQKLFMKGLGYAQPK